MNSNYKEDAHKDMVFKPLNYPANTCEPCHADYKGRLNKYELFLKEKETRAVKDKEEKKQDNNTGCENSKAEVK